MSIDSAVVETIRRQLLAWYRRSQRALPWRSTRDPYRIWISEIMCQQTQVDTVIPRYHRFLERFPDVAALASASEESVCEEWAGLGYYRRARNLHRAARWIAEEGGGEFPSDAKSLQRLPGVGRYTAGAIASIAFSEAAPLVDGNVARVLSRVFELDEPPDSTTATHQLWRWATQLVPDDDPGDFNQALMELGALVCMPKRVACLLCPLRSVCQGNASGRALEFPRPKSKVRRKPMRIAFAWVEDETGAVWLEQRPLEGLWAGLWELPSAPDSECLVTRWGQVSESLARIEHTLSHRDVVASVHRVLAPPRRPSSCRAYADPLEAPLSALARKAITALRRR